MRKIVSILGVAAPSVALAAMPFELPPEGILCGHAVYNVQGVFPAGYGNWSVQHGSPFDLIERTVREEQGNLIQFWFGSSPRPVQRAAWLDMEEIGYRYAEPDWKNLKNLRAEEFPELTKYAKARAGAGVARALRMCETNGLYSQLMYVSGVNEKYTKDFTKNPHYIGYDFGERFSCRP